MPHNLANFPMPAFHVPELNAPFEMVASYPTVIIRCGCVAKTTLIMIDVNGAVQCPACSRQFGIVDGGKIKIGHRVDLQSDRRIVDTEVQ